MRRPDSRRRLQRTSLPSLSPWNALVGRRSAPGLERQQAIDLARFEELEAAGHTHDLPLVVRRKLPIAWPLSLTLIFAAPPLLLFALGAASLGKPFAILAMVVIAIAWLIALSSGRGTIATLRASGIVLRQGEIPWKDILRFDLDYGSGGFIVEVVDLRIELARGPDVVVSLLRATEPPAVIYEIAHALWQRNR